MTNSPQDVQLSWERSDIEQKMLFRGGRNTQVNSLLSIIIATAMTIAFYVALIPLQGNYFDDMFRNEGPIPYAIVFFSSWSLAILFVKSRKLALQKKALQHDVVPDDVDFVLTAANVDTVLDRVYEIADEPRHFILFNRICVALANLRNLGRVGDVDEILRGQADDDESSLETSYSIISGFIWAIPVLGFIGTVMGLSDAIGGFGNVLQQTEDIEMIKDALSKVTGGLSTAFVTTLQALVAALFIQLLLTFIKKSEQEFMDQCSVYCTNQIVNRLRIMPFERQNQD